MKGQRQDLYPQLGRLEGERELIGEAIAEIKRRFEGIDEVESWNLLGQEEIRLEHVPSSTLDFDGGMDWDPLKSRVSFPKWFPGLRD